MSQYFKQLICLLFFCSITMVFAQEIPNDLLKERIENYKNDVRGPYHRIKWFCEDGTIRDAKDPCPDDIGGGIQHATFKDEVIEFGDKYHIYFGDILAAIKADDFWDASHNHSRLKQYQIGKYLMSVDDGWVLRKGQFYRGAIQSEDEENWGIEFYKKLLSSNNRLEENYYLIRQSLKDIPHDGDDNLAQKLRSESKIIADEYAPFMDIRVKIHSKPSKEDIALVDQFYQKHKSKLSPKIDKEFGRLKNTLIEYYKPIEASLLAQEIQTVKADDDLIPRIKAFLTSYSDNSPSETIVFEIADLLYNLRLSLTDFEDSDDRLNLLDLSIKLEEILLRKANEWETENLEEHLEKISTLACAAVGTGLIEIWEYQAIENSINSTFDQNTITLRTLNNILESSRAIVEWATAMVKGTYQETVDIYAGFEPKAYGFIDDRIRSSIALPLGESVSELGSFIADKSSLNNKVLDLNQQSSIRGLNPGYAKGTLVVVDGNPYGIEVNSNDIYVFQRPPSDLKPVAGILTVSEGNLVSHVQLLARNLGIPNAALSDGNLNGLEKYNGQEVFYAVSNKGNVIMKLASDMTKEEKNLFSVEKKSRNMVRVPVDNIELDKTEIINLRNINAKASGKLSGPKAANLGQLKSMFPENVVEGLVIPFGIFRQHLDQKMPSKDQTYWEYLNETFRMANSLKDEGKTDSELEKFQLERLDELRKAISGIELNRDFVKDLEKEFKDVFGEKLGEVPVFLRSDTNMEDLKEFTGAGLNLTLFNIKDRNEILEGIKKVWASPYTERSFKWRQQYLLNPENVFPSILIIPSVDVDYSGVMITKGINSGSDDDITVAFSRGAGGAVDGQSAETRLITPNSSMLLSPAREPDYIRLPETGGTKQSFANYNGPILNSKNISELRKMADKIKKTIPQATDSDYKGAYDVELGFKDNKLWLFQMRPFVENKNAKSSEYLASITPKIDYTIKIPLSTKI